MDLIMLVLVMLVIGVVVVLLIRAAEKIGLPPNWSYFLQLFALAVLVIYLLTQFVPLPNVLPGRRG